jgi:hypothetical protein
MRLVDTARTPSPRGIQWGQISISDQDAERTVPQTRQNGLPTSQPEECLQLAHLAYRADMKPGAILMIVTDYCALPPLGVQPKFSERPRQSLGKGSGPSHPTS